MVRLIVKLLWGVAMLMEIPLQSILVAQIKGVFALEKLPERAADETIFGIEDFLGQLISMD